MAKQPGQTTTELQSLLDAASTGKEQAYDALIARASDRLLGLTRKMLASYPHLRRWEETDDVFQNAAMRLNRSLRNCQPDSVRSFMGLATLEIRRTLIDLVRHHFGPEGAAGKHESWEAGATAGQVDAFAGVPDRTSQPSSLAEWGEFHEAVQRLPEQEREVFELVWYAGLTQHEIAALVEASVSTVQRRWYRARHNLYQLLGGDSPSSGGSNEGV